MQTKLTNITKPKKEFIEEYSLVYTYIGSPTKAGYSFRCDKNGNIDRDKMNPAARANLEKCEGEDKDKIVCEGVRDDSREVTEDRTGLCQCGGIVPLLSGFANGCPNCEREYNMSGDLLKPRSQWIEPIDPEPGVFNEEEW